jgi:hypothetical protein
MRTRHSIEDVVDWNLGVFATRFAASPHFSQD